MPRRKMFRRPRRRRRRRFARKRRMAVQPRSPIADSQVVKMRYSDRISINPAAGTIASHVFRANSIFDPDDTGVGHQPRGHDEWAMFYNQYTVIGSKITILAGSQSSSASDNLLISMNLADSSGAPLTPVDMMERTGAVWTYLTNMYGTGATRKLTKKYSAKRFFQHKSIKDADDQRTNFGSNPANPTFYVISGTAADGISNPSAVTILVQVDYICLLTGRKQVGES